MYHTNFFASEVAFISSGESVASLVDGSGAHHLSYQEIAFRLRSIGQWQIMENWGLYLGAGLGLKILASAYEVKQTVEMDLDDSKFRFTNIAFYISLGFKFEYWSIEISSHYDLFAITNLQYYTGEDRNIFRSQLSLSLCFLEFPIKLFGVD